MADSESDDGSGSSLEAELAGAAAAQGPAAAGAAGEAAAGADAAAAGDDAELREYGLSLGVDLAEAADADLKPVVLEAFGAPLPSSWSEHTDEEGRVYFFNLITQESSWVHPMDAVFKEVLELIQALRRELGTATQGAPRAGEAVQAHLELVHQRALQQLEGWSGPYASEAGHYYYNSARDVSSWENPVDEWQEELALRQRVLHRCLLQSGGGAHQPALGSDVGASGGSDFDTVGALDVPLPKLPLNLAAPRVGDSGPKTPSSSRSFATARSGRSARSARSARSPTPSARRVGSQLSPTGVRRTASEDLMMPGLSAVSAASAASAAAAPAGSASRQVSSSSAASSAPAAAPGGGEDSLEFTFGHTEGLTLPKFGVA